MRRHSVVTALLSGLVLYGGLYPLQGWMPGNAVAFLSERSPQSNLEDILVNICVFVPVGFFATLALTAHYRIVRAIGIAIAHGFALSFAIEAFQAFLPMRFSSALDLLMNTLGTVVGSVLAALYARRPKAPVPSAWFDASALSRLSIACAVVWSVAQITPFDVDLQAASMSSRIALLVHYLTLRGQGWQLGTVVVSALYFAGMCSLLCAAARPHSSFHRWVYLLLLIPVAMQSILGDLAITRAHLLGALLGGLMHWCMPPRRRQDLACFALLAFAAALVLSEVLPGTAPTYRSFDWIPFKPYLRSPFLGIGTLLDSIWPAMAIAACGGMLWPRHGVRTIAGLFAALTLGVFTLELMQVRLPGRFGEVTMPLVMGGVCLLSMLSLRLYQRQRVANP